MPLMLLTMSVGQMWGTDASLSLSSSNTFGTTSGSTKNDSQGNTWTCTGSTIGGWSTDYNGQQFGTKSTNNTYTFTCSIANATITGVSASMAAGNTTPTYNISVGGVSKKSGSLTKTMTPYSTGTISATGQISISINQNSASKAVYLAAISVSYTTGSGGGTTTYTVTYNKNNGTGTMTDSNSPYSSGATVTTLPNSFTRSNYIFTGWNTQAGGGGSAYAENATFSISANTTLYAQWFQSVLNDHLTRSTTAVTGTSYSSWSGKTVTSSAVYAGNSAGGNSSIQLRSTNNSGIVTTTSGGKAKYVTVVWNSNTTTTATRKIDIYGKNEAYTTASDLYATATQGTKLGSIEYQKQTVLAISGDYKYIGIRSNDGALYLSDIYIEWTPPTYSITYNCNNATSGCPSNATEQTNLPNPLPSAPTKTGYTFGGWYTNSGCTTSATAGAKLTDNITLYAKWTANTINLTLNKNNSDASGSAAGIGSIKYDAQSATISTAATRTGYTVEGYYSENTCAAANKVLTNTGAVVNSTVSGYTTSGQWKRTTTPTTLYAKWTANTNTAYKVKHYKQQLDGSYSATPDETDNMVGTTAASVTPAVKSYTGFTAPNTQTKAIAADGSMVIEYQYTRNSYALSWVTDGDALTGSYTSGNSIKYEASITAPNTPTKTGYTFAGWHNGTAVVTPATTMPAAATTYTATWTANTNTAYTVKHYKQKLDGTYDATPDETDNLAGTTAVSVTPARKSYTGFTAPVGQTVTILADGSLVVSYQYTRNSYSLSWVTDGDDLEGSYTSGNNIKYGASITAPNTPTKTGYVFAGWHNGTAVVTPTTMPAGNTTYTAQWIANTHTVTYVANDKTGGTVPTDDNSPYNHNATVTVLGGGDLAKTHYAFAGWTDGDNDYEEDDEFTITKDVELAARWTCDEAVTVAKAASTAHGSFTLDNSGELATCDAAVVVTVTPSPTTGYEFSAITQSGTVEGTINQAAKTISYAKNASGSSTINVTFAAKHITVTWNANGGSVSPASSEYVYDGSPLSSLPTPTRTGYEFDGWYTAAVDGDEINNVGGANKPSADVEYFAHWNVKSYSVTWMISGTEWTTDGQSSVNYGSHVTTLPTAPDPADYCGDKFMGWTTDAVYTHNSSPLYTSADDFPNAGDAGQTFYAVFADYTK